MRDENAEESVGVKEEVVPTMNVDEEKEKEPQDDETVNGECSDS